MLFRNLLSKMADLIYPRVCPVCDKASDRPGRHVCWSCFSAVEWYQDGLCDLCGSFFGGEIKHRYLCSACSGGAHFFDRARAAAKYDSDIKKVIHAFKYNGAVWLEKDLTDVLEGCLRAHFEVAKIDVVIPVPLFPAKERYRRYNQSALLAESLASRIDRRCDQKSLIRTRASESQTGFDAKSRRENVKNAFFVTESEMVYRRHILLVDDVMTTGATLDACAQALKNAGAAKVWAVSCARNSVGGEGGA